MKILLYENKKLSGAVMGESLLESSDGGRAIRCCSFACIAQFMQEPNLLGKPNSKIVRQ